MITYKLFRTKNDKLYPLYVEADREMEIGKELEAHVGEAIDETHVKAKYLSVLRLRPGFHSTLIPFTDWIGKKGKDGKLYQRDDCCWAECEVTGDEVEVKEKYGSRTLIDGWYKFKTNSKQKDPWIISNKLFIRRILTNDEVADICRANGIEPQPIAV